MNEMIVIVGDRVWRLTPAEARCAEAMFSDGATGLLEDQSPTAPFKGSTADAAHRAFDKLSAALVMAGRS